MLGSVGGLAAAATAVLVGRRGEDGEWRRVCWSAVAVELAPVAAGGAQVVVATRRHYDLNRTGLLLWRLCDGRHCGDELVAALQRATGIGAARARADVRTFLGALSAEGLVRWS